QLDGRAHQTYRLAGRSHQAGHQPIPGTRPEPGADVGRGRDAVEDDTGHEEKRANRDGVWFREDVRRRVDSQADDDDVAPGPEARTLAQRDPGEQDERADRDDHDTERHRQALGQTFV